MPLATIATGHYDATYNVDAASGSPPQKGNGALDIGEVEGSMILQRNAKGRVVKSSRWGDSTIDGIYAGGDTILIFTLKEWKPAVRGILWPWGVDTGDMGTPGVLASNWAGVMIWTALANTEAATVGPSLYTFHSCILDIEASWDAIHGVEERDITIAMICYPTLQAGGLFRWYTRTQA